MTASTLAIRSKPTTRSFKEGSYHRGTVLELKCSIKGQRVHGNPTWYQLGPHNPNWSGRGYVSAYYIKLSGAAPKRC